VIIAIIGAGKVGSTLGRRFADAGHDVVYGVRAVDDAKHAALVGARQSVAPIDAAAARAEIVVLTTPWAGAQDALGAAGDLSGKILVDATNPIGPGMVLTHGTTDSGAEQVARWSPGARVVKAFNSIGMEVMANPVFGDARAVLAICGDDAAACTTVASLAAAIGFDPVVLGPLTRARFIEPAALVWITAVPVLGTRQFAWGMLRRSP
jgi:8-hydroxy-5-deazaflavin:NADPH oxidoreductase